MDTERKRMRFELLLEKLFGNFPKFLLLNLIFAVPSLSIMTAFYFISRAIFNYVNIVFFLLCIIPIAPFYAGVVKVVRNIVRGDEQIKVFQTYLSGVKENFLAFLLHGVVVSAASIVSFLAINLYVGLLSQSWLFGALLFFCILVVVFMFFAAYYMPLMTVTFDLPLRYVYKNSLLMSYGEFKNNFFATLGEAVLIAIMMTILFVPGNATLLVVFFCVLWTLIFPAIYTYIFVFFIYNDMYLMVSGEGKKEHDKDKKKKMNAKEERAIVLDDADFSSIDVTKLKDTDDYIFFNGKMVKQSTLLKLVREKEQSPQEVKKDE